MTADVDILVLPGYQRENDSAAMITPPTRSTPQMEVSYRHLVAITDFLQRDLARLGISKASKVAIVLPNGLDFVAVFLSVLRQRAIAAPIDAQLTENEFKDIFSRMNPDLVVSLPTPSESSHGPGALTSAIQAALDLKIRVARCRRMSNAEEETGLGLQLALEIFDPAFTVLGQKFSFSGR